MQILVMQTKMDAKIYVDIVPRHWLSKYSLFFKSWGNNNVMHLVLCVYLHIYFIFA